MPGGQDVTGATSKRPRRQAEGNAHQPFSWSQPRPGPTPQAFQSFLRGKRVKGHGLECDSQGAVPSDAQPLLPAQRSWLASETVPKATSPGSKVPGKRLGSATSSTGLSSPPADTPTRTTTHLTFLLPSQEHTLARAPLVPSQTFLFQGGLHTSPSPPASLSTSVRKKTVQQSGGSSAGERRLDVL